MPKLFSYLGYIFHFYSNEHNPMHVHVDGNDTPNKYDMENKEWTHSEAKPQDLKKAQEEIENQWNNFFKKQQ